MAGKRRVRVTCNRRLGVRAPFEVPRIGVCGGLEFYVTLPRVYEVDGIAEPAGSAEANDAIRFSFHVGRGLSVRCPSWLSRFETDSWSVLASGPGGRLVPSPVSLDTFERILAEHARDIGDVERLESDAFGLILADGPDGPHAIQPALY